MSVVGDDMQLNWGGAKNKEARRWKLVGFSNQKH